MITDWDIKEARGCAYHRHILRVSQASVLEVVRDVEDNKSWNMSQAPRWGLRQCRGKFRNPSVLDPVHIHAHRRAQCAPARAYTWTAPHFIFILATSSNELVSSRGPTDLCKRPFLGRASPYPRKYFPSRPLNTVASGYAYEKWDGAGGDRFYGRTDFIFLGNRIERRRCFHKFNDRSSATPQWA